MSVDHNNHDSSADLCPFEQNAKKPAEEEENSLHILNLNQLHRVYPPVQELPIDRGAFEYWNVITMKLDPQTAPWNNVDSKED